MARHPWLSASSFLPALLALLLLIALACGGSESATSPPAANTLASPATPAPATGDQATPVPVPPATPAAAPSASGLVPKYGGIIPMDTFTAPAHFDPHPGANLNDVQQFSPFYNQLVEYNPIKPDEIIGDLAESWELSDDGLAYTFKLHQGVKWHDGEDLTADDVVFSINRIIEPGQPRPRAGRIRKYVDRVEEIDPLTVRIHVKFPSLAFFKLLAADYVKMVPRHVVEAGVDLEVFENAVGSGPFMPVSFREGVSTEFEKNPNYFKEGRPYFDGMKAFILTDKGAEIAAYKTERVLMTQSALTNLDIEDFIKLEEDEDFMSRFGFWWMNSLGALNISLNTEKPPFNDERARRAIFLALDRQELTDALGEGKFSIGTPMSPLNPMSLPMEEVLQLPGYRQLDGKKHPDDIAEARRLWKEVGHTEPFLLFFPLVIEFPEMAQILKQQFKNNLDLDLELRGMEVAGYVRQMEEGDFQMGLEGYGPMVNDPDDRFEAMYGMSSRNWGGWTDPRVEELFAQQQQELDPEKRRELVYEMQRITMTSNPGHVESHWKASAAIVHNRIKTEVGHYVVSKTIQTIMKHEHEWLEPE